MPLSWWPGSGTASTLPKPVQREIAKVLLSHTTLTQLDGPHALAVARAMRLREARPGTVLVREASTDNHFMLVVLEGDARIEHALTTPEETQVLGIAGRGAILGEQGLLDANARSATITAIGPMRLAVLERDDFQRLVKESPAAACGLLGAIAQSLSARLREANRRVRVLSSLHRVMQGGDGSAGAVPVTRVQPTPAPGLPDTPPRAAVPSRPPAVQPAQAAPAGQPMPVSASKPRGKPGQLNIPVV